MQFSRLEPLIRPWERCLRRALFTKAATAPHSKQHETRQGLPRAVAAPAVDYGSVRKEWRSYMEYLSTFPALQHLAFETAAFFTKPSELEFNLARTFNDKYALADKLGEGAFGRVHRVVPAHGSAAFDLDLAVKIIPKERVINLKDYMALKQEGRMMLLLGGTLNVVQFVGAYEDDENVYMVMEHCMGGDAFERLQKQHGHERIQEATVAGYMADILHVVRQCHQLRILHGDLKLENFLFADHKDESPLKLTDFGGASFIGENEMLEGVRGTPLYTAPEVLYTKYSFPSDMWSCGVILYRLLTGRFPFQGELLDERIRYEEIDFESEPWPRVTKEAKDLVRRLLERDVDKRLTAEQALRHPWLAAAEHQHHDLAIQRAPLNGTMVQRLQFYRALNGFQQSVLYEIACLLPLDMKQDVIVLFGEISVTAAARERGVGIAEFAACFEKGGYTITYGEAKSFLSRLDLDGDGLLSIDEFCTAFLDWAEIQRNTPVYWEGIVNQVFDSLDQDGDGKLTVHDIARQLKPVGSINNSHHSFLNDVKRCFQQTDLDSDGWIDRSEFQAMVHVHEHAYSQYTRRLKRGGSPQMNNQV